MSEQAAEESTRRARSPRAPAIDLQDAIDLAKAIYSKAGGVATVDVFSQLAGVSVTSSRRILRVVAMRLYGLIDGPEKRLVLTPLAESIIAAISPEEEKEGRRRAFLNVPIYRRIAEDFRGKAVPEERFLTNHIQRNYPIDPENAPGWAKGFVRSGDMASFFNSIGGRKSIPFDLESVRTAGLPLLSGSDRQSSQEQGGTDPDAQLPRPRSEAAEVGTARTTGVGCSMQMGAISFSGPTEVDDKVKKQVRALISWLNSVYELDAVE